MRYSKVLISVIAAGLITGSIAALAVDKYKKPATDGSNSNPTQQNSGSSNTANQGNDKPYGSSSDTTPNVNSSASPAKPSGSFVSAHKVKSTDALESVCSTTPGATCNISFTSGSTTKSLGAKVASSKGDMIWSWRPVDLGLSDGIWQISATATLNGKTETVQDPLNLQVSQ